jgi:hypothetical protein
MARDAAQPPGLSEIRRAIRSMAVYGTGTELPYANYHADCVLRPGAEKRGLPVLCDLPQVPEGPGGPEAGEPDGGARQAAGADPGDVRGGNEQSGLAHSRRRCRQEVVYSALYAARHHRQEGGRAG